MNEINNRVNKYCIMELKKKASNRKNEGHTNFCFNLSKDEAEKCGVKYKIKITEFLESVSIFFFFFDINKFFNLNI